MGWALSGWPVRSVPAMLARLRRYIQRWLLHHLRQMDFNKADKKLKAETGRLQAQH